MKQIFPLVRNLILPATLNSYSVVFFFNNTLMAIVLMLITFFNFYAGLSGLLAVLIAVVIGSTMNLDQVQLKKGLFSFNALLTGIGMGTFFDPSWVFFSLLILAALITLILSVTLASWLGKYGLPVLSTPFVVTFWILLLPSSEFENLGLTQRNLYWINDVYAIGGNELLHLFQTIDSLPIHSMIDTYLRALSSIFFQDNLISGLLIAIVLLLSSRIAFSLTVVGFLSAYFFAQFSGSEAASITYYNIGANYIMVALAIGAFFIIPSRYSYLWTILLVPLTSIVLLFMSKLLGFIDLPVFSLPFTLVVIFFVYFLQLRISSSKLILTTAQYYSPEINLYTFNNNKERLSHLLYFPIYLPFWGEWTISQGHDGLHTHKGEWGKAYDFTILDEEGKSHEGNGALCENYYCYNKPILAPADGIVEEIDDNIDDNEIGKVNTTNNWGNSIIIRHITGIYTQISHIKKGSFKVAKGDFVKQGEIIANCGNSGRSPEPHLHFQVQASPILGAKTLDYPFAYYHQIEKSQKRLFQFSLPKESHRLAGITHNQLLKNTFNFMPNQLLKFSYTNEESIKCEEEWETYTDAYNQKYFYCKETESTAYYINDNSVFYFTAFFGNKKSLLYYFYLSAYKVFLGNFENESIQDAMPLNSIQNKKISFWLNDFIAPFYSYLKVSYSMKLKNTHTQFEINALELESSVNILSFGKSKTESTSRICIKDNSIKEFHYSSAKINLNAVCVES